MRIIGTVLLEQSEAWSTDRVYFDMVEYLGHIGYANNLTTTCSAPMKAESLEGEAADDCIGVNAA